MEGEDESTELWRPTADKVWKFHSEAAGPENACLSILEHASLLDNNIV